MSDDMVTVATFPDTVQANLAKNRLEQVGIPSFLEGEETVGMAWHLSNAIGDIKLQVRTVDAEQALAVLSNGDDEGPDDEEDQTPPDDVGHDDHDEEPELTLREQNAERAYRGALLGLVMLPLQVYVFWVLLKVFVSDERLGTKQFWRALIAAVINVPLMVFIVFFVRWMFTVL